MPRRRINSGSPRLVEVSTCSACGHKLYISLTQGVAKEYVIKCTRCLTYNSSPLQAQKGKRRYKTRQ